MNKSKKPDIRFLNDMREVLYDQQWLKTAPNFEVYYMYRGVKKKDNLRYDITIIPPKMLGKEYVKTKGHVHPKGYQELYKVLEGKAIFLIQKSKNNLVERVFAIKAKRGDVIIVPPECGHTTINPSQKTLKLANWVSQNCKSDYLPFEKIQGACYYYAKSGWIKNKNYKKIPKLEFQKPKNSIPKNLDFLEKK